MRDKVVKPINQVALSDAESAQISLMSEMASAAAGDNPDSDCKDKLDGVRAMDLESIEVRSARSKIIVATCLTVAAAAFCTVATLLDDCKKMHMLMSLHKSEEPLVGLCKSNVETTATNACKILR